MGLIDQAARQKNSPKALSTIKGKGLLGKIRGSSSFDTLIDACSQYVSDIAAERFLLLLPSEDRLIVAAQLSLDLTTYRRFTPTSVFFSSQFQDASWYTLRGECLEPFYSLFSSRERDSLTALYVRPAQFDDKRIYIVIVESTLDVRRKTIDTGFAESIFEGFLSTIREQGKVLESLSQSGQVNRDQSVIDARIDSALSDGKVGSLVSLDFSSLFGEVQLLESNPTSLSVYHAIVYRMIKQAGPTNVVNVSPNMKANLALFFSSKTDPAAYVKMMMKPLESLFGTHRVSKITALYCGSSSNKAAIRAFLRGDT